MNIYILNNSANSTLKTIAYNDFTLSRYNNKEYNLLYPSYDSSLHTIVIAESLPANFNIIDGEVVELTDYEKYVNGDYSLADGEYIEDEAIVSVDCPDATYYEWDSENNEWVISDENLEAWKIALKSALGDYRDKKLAEGILFEDTYTIKGRVQDVTDATACYNMAVAGIEVTWFYSSGEDEKISTVERMTEIYLAIGNFRTSQFTRESEVKALITDYTESELLGYDIDLVW